MIKSKTLRRSSRQSVEKRQRWEKHVNTCKKGNLNRKAYCREHSLDYEQFQYWYRKFKSEKPAQEAFPLIPVQEKSVAAPGNKVLCTALLPNNVRLLIHDVNVVKDILRGAV